MPISWNEIRHNAIRFTKEWTGETREEAEAKSFWDDFFQVFGLRRRTVATFEEPVKNISGDYGYIDLFWRGVLLVEHKSFGKDLGKAESQAFRYIQDLLRAGREKELPRYVIVSDFARIALHDLEPEEQGKLPLFDKFRVATLEFPLAEFHRHIHDFAFIPGYKQHKFQDQDPINIRATEIMGNLHDALAAGGYGGHPLERFLVRVLFCLFAEDTGLFERDAFGLYLENHTAPDGSDLGIRLARLFEVLDTPVPQRQKNLDEDLAALPYVNGALFKERLPFADFNSDMRNALLACTRFDWSRISPAIFGSLFQAVMEKKERRQIGGHYTNERNILKVVRALFLDDLRAEFELIKADRSTRRTARLEEFHEKICRLRFLDPACGCGNFLVITYRELRALELEVLQELFSAGLGAERGTQRELTLDEINRLSRVDVDQFYGIEISEWPARIAEVAMWLMDHQMNLKVSEAFGQLYQRLPLKKSPTIVCGNALRLDWAQILPPDQCTYVLGNPPFVGKQFATAEQKADMDIVCGKVKGAGVLDYVAAWYFKAGAYIQRTNMVVGFVSTNSISQGEQVGILWNELFTRYHLKIHFAHRTFPWESEARGKAHVHVVIIGFGACDTATKRIYDYEGVEEKVTVSKARNISPYLVEGSDIVVLSRSKPVCDAPEMAFGSMPNDGGHLILSADEKTELLKKEPGTNRFLRPILGSQEFINGISKWCLWLKDVSPGDFRSLPEIMKRVEGVRKHRETSTRETTRELAKTPTIFGEIRQPSSRYLGIPKTSSERRAYIPMAFIESQVIANTELFTIATATLYHLGVLSSAMLMAWVRQICGRLKSDYRFSNGLVYNNYPWPATASDKQRAAVEAAAQAVLDAREQFLPPKDTATLADLYDPLAMPPTLVKAHTALDRAVDLCYRPAPFTSERQRVEFLFALYEKLTAPLIPSATKTRKRSKTPAAP